MPEVHELYTILSTIPNKCGFIVLPDEDGKFTANDPFILEDTELKIYKTGEVYVPAKIMKKYGYQRKDGRYALAVLPMLRPLNGKLVRGAVIPNVPGIEDWLEKADFRDIITWENGKMSLTHGYGFKKACALWYLEDYRFKIEEMEMNA